MYQDGVIFYYYRDNNMDYIQEDPYSSNGRQLYNDSYNQGYNQHYIDQRSPHASHTSLHSTESNRNRMVNQVLYIVQSY